MGQGEASKMPRNAVTREAFLARFKRVPSGLDPDQVYELLQKASARIEQLETHARRSSAPFVIQATLREAAEICGKATEMAEHAYDEIVAAARREADGIRAEAQRGAGNVEQTSQDEGGRLREQARREAQAIVAEARREADELRKTAEEYLKVAETTLEETRRYARQAAGSEPAAKAAPDGSWSVVEPALAAPDNEAPADEGAPTPPAASSNGEIASLTSALERLAPRVHSTERPPPPEARPAAPREDRPAQPGRFEMPRWLEG
jgi:cell division septum initiation protein DivIVA